MDDQTGISKIYNKIILENFDSPVSDLNNSYRTGLTDPSLGHSQPGMSEVSAKSDAYAFPKEMPTEEKLKLLKKFLKDEIDSGEWDDRNKAAMSDFLKAIL